MKFLKMHGLGNDFVIVEEKALPGVGSLKDFAVKVCNRHLGIGADGLVVISPSEKGDLSMRIYNSDGSEAEMCGNAIRCIAKYAYEEGIVSKSKMAVETLAGRIMPELIIREGKVVSVKVDMGKPRLSPEDIPIIAEMDKVVAMPIEVLGQEFKITCVSMGNPHCIVFVPDLKEIKLQEWGQAICGNPLFPKQTNVEFIQVLDDANMLMRVWERGAGETLACGTGACASAVAGVLNGKTGPRVTVHLAVGNLKIEWNEDSRKVFMTGPAERVFEGTYLY